MDNPFEESGRGDKDEEEVLSDGDSEDVKALMKAQLEVSPLVPPVPPMPGESEQAKRGPHLAISSANQGSSPVLLKKRKFDEHPVTEQDFHDIGSPTSPPTKRPSLPGTENPDVAALHGQPTLGGSGQHHQTNPVASTFPLATERVLLPQEGAMAAEPPIMGAPPMTVPPTAGMSSTITGHPTAVLPPQPAGYPVQAPMVARGNMAKGRQEAALVTAQSGLIPLAPRPAVDSEQPDKSRLQADDTFVGAEDGAQMPPSKQESASPPTERSESSISSPSLPVEHDGDTTKDRRMGLLAIVTGARSPSKPTHQEPVDNKPKPISVNVATEATQQKESQNEEDSDGKQADESKKRSKKKVPQPKSRVLVSKKESDAAKIVLADKVDLLSYLPPDDCKFLAEKLWVFTARQLLRILESSSDVNESVGSSESDERIKIDRATLARKLAEKFFLDRNPMYKQPDQNTDGEAAKSPDNRRKDTQLQGEKQPAVPIVSRQTGGEDAETNDLATEGKNDHHDSETVKNPFNMASPTRAPGSPEEIGINASKDFPYSIFRPEQGAWIKDSSRFKATDKTSEASSPAIPIPEQDQFRADSKLNEWHDLLTKKSEPANVPSIESSFPLDGPIGILFPASTRNFLASVKITSLYQFLSLRKTETGAIIDMFRLWRDQNGLSKLPNIALAKHFLGVMYRLETAIESDLPLNSRTQKWIHDPMVIMTGAAKDFLIDHLSLLSGQQFLECRTKELADKLVEWRISKGMAPLKGSGKVAMISSWKACAREELEIQSEEGKILEDVDLQWLSSRCIPIVADETKNVPVAQKPKTKAKPAAAAKPTRKQSKPLQSNLQVDYASHSRLFVEHVLGKEIADFLSDIGVGTAAELQKADTSEDSTLCQRMIAATKADDYFGCQNLVDEWRSRLQQQLKDMSSDLSTQKPASPGTASAAKAKSPASLDQIKFADPYEALSSVTKRFLTSIGIRTGEEFLSARTTDIAADFVKWRIKEGKPELKGLGAIASVSGWKAQCRKAARDMGMEDIATLEPGNRSSWGASRTKKITSPKADKSTQLKISLPTLPHAIGPNIRKANVLSGNSSAEVVVLAYQGSNRRFFFELSLRKAGESDPIGLFITYKGASPSGDAPMSSSVKTILLEEKAHTKPKAALPVLQDASGNKQHAHSQFDERAPFYSDSPDYGLIDLSAYGVLPVERQDLGELKDVIRRFVFGEEPKVAVVVDPPSSRAANVLVQKNSRGHRYYLYLAKTLERGQACQLLFPSVSDQLRGGADQYDLERHGSRPIIEDALLVLSQDDLIDLLKWMKDALLVAGSLKDMRNESGDFLPKFFEARRRLHWVSRFCLTLLKTLSDQSKETGEMLYFGPDSLEKDELEIKELFAREFSRELWHSLAIDPVCGDHMSIWFCTIARKMLDACVAELVHCYQLPTENSAGTFSQKMNALMGSFFDLEEKFKKGDVDLSNLYQRVPDDPLFKHVPEGQKIPDPEPKIACEYVGRPLDVVFLEKTKTLNKEINVAFDWYQELLAGIGSSTLHAFDKLLDEREKTRFDVSAVLDSVKAASPSPGRHIASLLLWKECIKVRPQTLSSIKAPVVPGSRQFFLGIVWPALRGQGWRLEAGDFPEDVVYFPPKTSQKKRSAFLKQEGNRKRMRLSRVIDKLGWGSVKKLTKRLVAAVAADLSKDVLDVPYESLSVSVRDATDALVEWVQKDLDCDDDGACTERVKSIASALRECFDELAPFMNDGAGWPSLEGAAEPSAKYRAEQMLEFLLVLPGILRQSDLSLQEISDTFQVIQDITDMFASNYKELLDERFHPPVEKYDVEGAKEKSILAERLKLLKPLKPPAATSSTDAATNTDTEDANELTEAILDEDKGELTDFVVRVMEQFIPSRATDKDAEKKFRRIHVGFPGLTCRHCLAGRGEGRYFFSTIESLTTASTVLEKHVLKCPSMPENVKTDVINARMTHAAQRKMLENGSQQAYFNRLWDRLRSSKIGGKAMNEPMVATGNNDLKASGTEGILIEAALEFRDHVEILDYVRTRAPWKNNRSIQAALGKYYSCLDYGGRIYQTPSMPERFSSEWLLAKICPKKYEYTKGKSLPG